MLLFIIEVLVNFQKLHNLDNEFCQVVQALTKEIFENHVLHDHKDAAKRNISWVGSLAEGSSLPRVFSLNERFEDGINREIELDVDFLLLEIPVELKHIVHEDKQKRGIVKIQHSEGCKRMSKITLSSSHYDYMVPL